MSKLIFPQNFQNPLNSVTLTYFDRKAFFLSITRLASVIIVCLLAIMASNRILHRNEANRPQEKKTSKIVVLFQEYVDEIQRDYHDFLENNLNIRQSYPEILEQAAGDFNLLDGQLTEIVGHVYRIQRELNDQRF